MIKISTTNDGRTMIWCPGCGEHHWFDTRWQTTGTSDLPTFSPSLLVISEEWKPPVTLENMEKFKQNPWLQTKVIRRCHSFVRDGKIEFLSDSTHGLAGQTVALPELEEVR